VAYKLDFCYLTTFRVRRCRGKMYVGQACLCVCVYLCVRVSLTAFPHYCMDLNLTWRNGRRYPVAVHCWADLQSVHWFRCYDNIELNASAVYSLCAWCLQLSTKLHLCVFELLEEWLWTVADVLGNGNVQLGAASLRRRSGSTHSVQLMDPKDAVLLVLWLPFKALTVNTVLIRRAHGP